MPAPLKSPRPAPNPTALDVFLARAKARAAEWSTGQIALHDAVDDVQRTAEAYGLIAELGQNRVQELMVEAFAPLRDDLGQEDSSGDYDGLSPTFARACRKADAERARWPVEQPRAPQAPEATVEALLLSLRERGLAALAERACLQRLAQLSSEQVRQVITRLIVLQTRYPAITDELLLKLAEQLS